MGQKEAGCIWEMAVKSDSLSLMPGTHVAESEQPQVDL